MAMTTEYMPVGLKEVIPEAMKAKDLAQSSLVMSRTRVRLTPQGSQTVSSQGGATPVVNFFLQDNASLADLQSMALSFEATINDISGSNVFDDGIWSVLNRLVITCQSQVVEDTQNLAKAVNARLYASEPSSLYENFGSFMGQWKLAGNNGICALSGLDISGTPIILPKYEVIKKEPLVKSLYTNGRNKFVIPMAFLSEFFAIPTYLSLPLMGQIQIQLQLASSSDALVNSGVGGSGYYTLGNLALEYDAILPSPMYLQLLEKIATDPQETGLRYVVNSTMSASQNTPAQPTGSQQIVVSKATSNLRSMMLVQQSTNGLKFANYPKQSTFPNCGLQSVQIRVGSTYFPLYKSEGARLVADTQRVYGGFESVVHPGVVDVVNYFATTTVDGTTGATNMKNVNGGEDAVFDTASTGVYCDAFVYGYNFDKIANGKMGEMDLDGISSLSTSAGQLVAQLDYPSTSLMTTNEAIQITAFVKFSRILEVRAGATRVIG